MINLDLRKSKTRTARFSTRSGFLLAVLSLFLLPMLQFAPGASAHAKLESSNPVAGSTVENISELNLNFNEQVAPLSFKLSTKTQELSLDFAQDKTTNVVLKPKETIVVPDNYFLAYQVVSADSHIISGVVPFTVGKTNPSQSTEDPSTLVYADPPELTSLTQTFFLDRVLELLSWLFFFIALGLVLSGSIRSPLPYIALGATATTLRLIGTYDTFGGNIIQINESKAIVLTLASFLVLWLTQNKNLKSVQTFSGFKSKNNYLSKKALLVAFMASIIFAAQALFSGHFTENLVFTTLNFTHMLGATLWFAALISILVNPSTLNITRSSLIATFSVIGLIIATVFMLILEVFPLLSIEQTWSNLIILKISFLTLALILGLLNNLSVRRLVRTAPNLAHSYIKKIRARTFVEVILLIFIIVFSASLSLSSPNKPIPSTQPQQQSIPMQEDYEVSPEIENDTPSQESPLALNIELDYGYTGVVSLSSTKVLTMIEFELEVFDDFGEKITPIQAEYELYNDEKDFSGFNSSFMLHKDHLMASFLAPVDGTWEGKITLQIDDFTTVEGDFSFNVTN